MLSPKQSGLVGRLSQLSGATRVWLLSAGMAIVSLLAIIPLVGETPLSDRQTIPLWAIALAFYAAELLVVHIRFRRDAHSFSMSEVPLVAGLFFAEPILMIVGQLIANLAVLGYHRKQAGFKVSFNVIQFVIQSVVAIYIFRAVVGDSQPSNASAWIAGLVATFFALLIAHLLINLVITVSGGRIRLREMVEAFGLSAFATAMNTSLALTGISVFLVSAPAALATTVVPMTLFLGYRAYLSQRQERTRLKSLYDATRDLHESPQIDSALLAAARHARGMFDAEFCEVLLFPAAHGQAYRTVVGQTDEVAMVPVDLWAWHDLWVEVKETGVGRMITGESIRFGSDGRDFEVNDAIIVPITERSRVVGSMMVANQVGDVGSFEATDLELMATLASQVAVSLENGRLVDSLAQLTELKEELRHQALHDALTGLANRVLLGERLEHALRRSRRSGEVVAVIFLDLDDFKTINDTMGHAVGDGLLQAVGQRLETQARPGDTIARFGGDEFAILLEDLPGPEYATEIAARVHDQLRRPFPVEGKSLSVGASLGIAIGSPDDAPDQLLRNADAAMYAAKRSGKGTYRIYKAEMHAELIEQLKLRSDLRTALEDDDFGIRFQPIVSIADGSIVGAEALVRWHHPMRGELSPTGFIPAAEQSRQIIPIGRWVLQHACEQVRDWQRAGLVEEDFWVSVNLSTRQLDDPDLVRNTRQALESCGLEPRHLVLEVTESAMLDTSTKSLERLADAGVRLAIDDFGTGYSSLGTLDQLPLDILKVDKSFVDRLRPEESSPVARTIVQLGHALGHEVIVEGIESMQQLELVRAMGADLGQGYLFAPPVLAEDFEPMLGKYFDVGDPTEYVEPRLRLVQ